MKIQKNALLKQSYMYEYMIYIIYEYAHELENILTH